MREVCHVSGDKHIIRDNGIDVEGTASRVTADPKGAYGQPGIAQPFRIPDRSQHQRWGGRREGRLEGSGEQPL
jgi:hypothetical protein